MSCMHPCVHANDFNVYVLWVIVSCMSMCVSEREFYEYVCVYKWVVWVCVRMIMILMCMCVSDSEFYEYAGAYKWVLWVYLFQAQLVSHISPRNKRRQHLRLPNVQESLTPFPRFNKNYFPHPGGKWRLKIIANLGKKGRVSQCSHQSRYPLATGRWNL